METWWYQCRAFIHALPGRAGVLLFLILVFNFTGCVSGKDQYPAHWSTRMEWATADLSGRYNTALIHILSLEPLSKSDSAECIFDFVINSKEVKYRRDCPGSPDPERLDYTSLSIAHFDMELKQKKEGLMIVYKPRSHAGNPVAGYQKEYVMLSKARDGSLIVEKVGKVYGLAFMIFPVAASEHLLYRFYDGKVEKVE